MATDLEPAQSHQAVRPLIDRIQEVWAETLGLAAVDPDDDFFALGGHSIKAAAAVARLSERVGFDLPLHALFEAPTPAEMVELIEELRGEPQRGTADAISPFYPDWAVPLQREGARRPVFVFPATHNEPRALAKEAHVAALVGRQHPFWGFRQDHPWLDRAREGGVPALAAEYVVQMRAIQGAGPFLLFANCGGGYLAWDVARQLLAAGETIAGMLFREVPLRSDFDALQSGHTPAYISRPWRLTRDYRPQALQTDLTFLMNEDWLDRSWWAPWQKVARGSFETVVMSLPDSRAPDFNARRDETIAHHVRDWIEQAEARVRSA